MGIWYRTGTASVANGSATVTGVGTAWLIFVRPGDRISFDAGGKWYEVLSVNSNTSITLATNFAETTIVAPGGAYAIDPSSYRHQIPSDILEQLRQVLAAQTNVFDTVGTPPADLGNEGALALDFASFDLYYRDATAWVGPTPLVYSDAHRFDFAIATAMADPGAGFLRFNNATLASVTAIAIDSVAASPGAPNIEAVIREWDDSTNLTHRGILTIRNRANPAAFAIFRVSGASVENAGWTQLTVTHLASAGTFAANNPLAVSFVRTGNAGDVLGPASSVNARIAVFSGTTGKSLVDGGQTISEVITAAANQALTTVRNGVAAAFDTLAEVAADLATKVTTGANATLDHTQVSDLTLTELAPLNPPSDTVRLFARRSGRMLPAFVGPAGLDSAIQPHFGRNKVGIWTPPGNAVTLPGVFGLGAPTVLGTSTARNVATTNILTRTRRLGQVSAATAGQFAGLFFPVAQFTVGNGAGLGGFYLEMTFGMSSAAALTTGRFFAGMSTSIVAPTNVEPSTLTQSFGIAKLSTSQNLHLVFGGSAAQAPIDLGANFPADSLSVDLYDLVLFCSPNNGDVVWQVRRLGTNFVAEGTITNSGAAVLPQATDLLAPRIWRTNNATAQAVAVDIVNIYVETDY